MRREGWGYLLSPTISAEPGGVGAASQRLTPTGGTIGIADAHRDDGKRFVVHADEKLTALVELEFCELCLLRIALTNWRDFSKSSTPPNESLFRRRTFPPKCYRPPHPPGVKGGCSPQNNRGKLRGY